MIKAITKLWMTLLLLCVAGVANAATEYEIDQKFTSIAELDGISFAIVDETPTTPTAMGIGIPGHGNGWDMYFGTITEAYNSNACYYKLEAVQTEGLEGYYYLRTFKNDGTMYTAWGNTENMGFLNSQTADQSVCFALGLEGRNGQDGLNLAVWAIEVSEGKFALKNIGTGLYLHGDNLPAKYEDPFYFTFCTLKAGGETPDPVIEEPVAPLADGELIPDFFSICDEGGIPYGYEVKFGSEDRAYPTTYGNGARMFAFAEGGDFTRGLYFREGYVQYGNVKKLALEAGKKYIVHFNSAMWKDNGATLDFTITKEGESEALLTKTIDNTPNVNGSKDAVTGSTSSEIEFTPDADGNYILKWNAVGFKECILANVGVKVEASATVETVATFDFNASNHATSSSSSSDGDITADEVNTVDGVTMTITPNPSGTPNRYWSTGNGPQLRMYGGKMTLVAPEGKAITKVVINQGKWNAGNTFNGVAASESTWEGNSTNVVLEIAANTQMNSVVVTIADANDETTSYGVPSIANTAETAYTVAEAVALIEAGDALSETVFVKGIVSKVDNFNDQYKSITYWISADGSTEGQQFECYSGKGLEGADFTSVDDVEVGAEVIVKGTMKKFVPEEGDPIYEFNYNNELVSYKAPVKPLFADGKYYIFNKGAQKYLAAGGAWGTHAALTAEGLDYTIAFADGKYTLDSQVSNGGANNFLNGSAADGPWNDGGAFGWTIEEVSEGVYTINNGTKFIAAGENNVVTFADDATAETAQWTLVAAADRFAELANATAEAPVNATFIIKGANFNRNDLRNRAWTATKSGGNQTIAGPDGNRTNYGCESWNNTFEVSQTIENLPDGIYEFTIAGYGTNGTTKIFANETEEAFVNTTSAANFGAALDEIAAGSFTGNTTGKVTVIGGILKIGVKRTEQVGADWAVFDNARLTYFGAPSADAYEPAYTAALAAAQAALADADYAAVTGEEKTALEKAVADYGEIAEPTVDLYKEAIAALTAATTAFKDAKAAYEALIAAKTAKAEFDFAAYPYASEAKKAAAEATLTAEAKNAADAKAKTEGIDKAFRQYAESNALLECQYGAAVNMTNSIVNPNAEEAIAEPWAIVKGEGSGGNLSILDGEPLTDGEGKNYKYFDGGDWGANAWDVALEQTISLPAGKYYLTAAGRASGDVDMTLFAGENTAKIAAIGNQGGLFGRGWSDASVEFEMAEAGEIKIGVRGVTSVVHNWMSFTRFRLMQFGVAGEDAPEIAVPEGKTNLIENGNLAGESVASFVAKEYPSTDIVAARIVDLAGKDNSRGIVVKAGDDTANSGALAWDSQFWINFNQALPTGTKLHVEFDYAASKAAKGSTQAHGEPGAYQHWAAIGDVNFTTEWQHFSADVEVSGDMAGANGMKSIAFNLQEEKTATDYYFDNFGVWAEIPEPVQEWEDLIVNGNMEGESMECFYVTEQGVGGPFVAIATEGIGKDGSKAVKVQSADDVTEGGHEAQDWDSQFFIRLPYQLPAGTQYKVSFDYKADKAGDFDTQAHANPGQYIHWAFCGSGSFTTEWQTYEKEGTVPSECDGSSAQKTFQTIAFNLAKNRVATEFVFDNVKFFVPKDIVSSLTKNPDENPVPYPVGIQTVNIEKNAEGIFNLNGQKVMKTQKGLYIMNGKKVVIK